MNLSRWLNPPLSSEYPLGRPGRQAIWIMLFVLGFALLDWKPGFAQAAATKQPILAESVTSQTQKPPLPFIAPLVGPFIKNSFPNDINRRTTAFIPQSLDNLTSISLPKTTGKWIRVDLSEQTVVAYEGKKPLRAFRISSGLPGTPTVTGTFHIRTKVLSQTMYGGTGNMYYNLPGVKWVQYFYQDYSFHGTYWHNNFGHPMSHGCLNMTNADAKWLFDWADPVWDGKSVWQKTPSDDAGTLVIITE